MLLFLHETMYKICMLSIAVLDLCFEHSSGQGFGSVFAHRVKGFANLWNFCWISIPLVTLFKSLEICELLCWLGSFITVRWCFCFFTKPFPESAFSIVILDLCFEHSCERFYLCSDIAVRVLQSCENHAGFFGNCVTIAEIVFLLLLCQDTQGLWIAFWLGSSMILFYCFCLLMKAMSFQIIVTLDLCFWALWSGIWICVLALWQGFCKPGQNLAGFDGNCVNTSEIVFLSLLCKETCNLWVANICWVMPVWQTILPQKPRDRKSVV